MKMIKTEDYRNALSGIGPQTLNWNDKPHRLVYDLCNEIERLRVELKKSRAAWSALEAERMVRIHSSRSDLTDDKVNKENGES
jgi:hypothetical protein